MDFWNETKKNLIRYLLIIISYCWNIVFVHSISLLYSYRENIAIVTQKRNPLPSPSYHPVLCTHIWWKKKRLFWNEHFTCHVLSKLAHRNAPSDYVMYPIHWENYISISFHMEWDMIVVTVFLSILYQMKFHLAQNRKKNCHHDSTPRVTTTISNSFNLKGNRIRVFSVYASRIILIGQLVQQELGDFGGWTISVPNIWVYGPSE